MGYLGNAIIHTFNDIFTITFLRNGRLVQAFKKERDKLITARNEIVYYKPNDSKFTFNCMFKLGILLF